MKIRRTKRPTVALYLTRWLGREPHRNYIRTLSQDWAGSGIDLRIAVHGRCPLDPGLKGRQDVLDMRERTEGGLSTLAALCFQDGLQGGCDVVGLMDDDASYLDPREVGGLVCDFWRDYPGAGVAGPIGAYRMMATYKGRLLSRFPQMTKVPWTSYGSQFYVASSIRKVGALWWEVLREMRFRMDAGLYMLLHHQGYPCHEFRAEGYRHTCSKGDNNRPREESWYRRRVQEVARDFTYLKSLFGKLGSVSLQKDARTLAKIDLEGLWPKTGTEAWKTPRFRSMEEVRLYFDAISP